MAVFINVGPQCCVDGCYRKHIKGHGMCKEHQDMYDRGLRLTINYGTIVRKHQTESCDVINNVIRSKE